MTWFEGEVKYVRVWHRVLTLMEIRVEYIEGSLLFLRWYQRLIYWLRQTFLLLLGKKNFLE